MDSGMEDSGFDSDQKSHNGTIDGTAMEVHSQPSDLGTKSASYKALKKTSELQKKIERQRDLARKSKPIDQQPKRSSLLSRTRSSEKWRKFPGPYFWCRTTDNRKGSGCAFRSLPGTLRQHGVNLAVQETARKVKVIGDALEFATEAIQLITASPKRQVLFENIQVQANEKLPGIRPFCPVRWAVRASAMYSLLQNYSVLQGTFEVVSEGSPDVESYYRQQYFEAIDTVSGASEDRFHKKNFLVARQIEQVLTSGKGLDDTDIPSTYAADLNIKNLKVQLQVLSGALPADKTVTVESVVNVLRQLPVPPVGVNRAKEKEFSPLSQDQCQPLVTIVSDDSEEDEFDVPRLPRATQKEISEQLIKDGYNLDLEPDDEDLDLIPPRPLNERCSCCQMHSNCLVQ
ncbi:hypothetical protein BaRGS_00032610 [Batillaria attramentaria]|uniref:Uncharacterized protein n=1 Tax=Batillaria attramentaria TaxID=370345 RepID=A0ABD0JNT5_9CAEN